MNWKVWLHSVAAAAIGGAVNALSAAIVLPQDVNFSPDGLQNMWKIAMGGALVSVLLVLKQSPLPDLSGGIDQAKKMGLMLLVVALGCTALQAQTLNTQATASAFKYQGSWLAGTEQTQSFPVLYFGAQKGQVFSLGAREIIVPGSFQMYGALGNYQPDISKLIAKTTFNPDQFNLSFDVMGGTAMLPNNVTKPAIEGRVNFAYAFSPNVALTGAYAGGGLIGKDRFVVVSAGLQYRFGAQNVPSMAMKRMLKRQAAKKLALQMSGGL